MVPRCDIRIGKPLLVAVASWLALGCGSTPTEPADRAAFVVVAGDSQLHFPGATAFAALAAGLVDANGQRVTVSGLRVSWSVVQGAGAVEPTSDTTSSQGLAGAKWTLGVDEGVNRVMVSAEGVAPAEFTARAANPGPIVFVSGRRAGFEGNEFEGFPGDLYVMREDGSDVMPLLSPDRQIQFLFDPAWSPDGSKILFVRAMPRPFGGMPGLLPIGMFFVTANATTEEQVPAVAFPDYVQFLEEPAWERFGNRIIARLGGEGDPSIPPEVKPGQLHLMNSLGIGIRPLATATEAAHSPSWSPTADRIAFSCEIDGMVDLCVVDDHGNNFRRLTADSVVDLDPAWSPDGAKLLFARDPDSSGGIWMVNADGSDLTQVISGNATSPSWAPDGLWFVVTIDAGGQLDIYLVDLATGQRTNLTNSPHRDREATWRW